MDLTFTLDTIQQAAKTFISQMQDAKVFAFYGRMGAGKTTFIKAVCQQLSVTSSVNSPTFAIINEYRTAGNTPIYHFDFYRIKNVGEAFDIGCEDYFYSGNPCFIEWPEKIDGLLPEDCTQVTIEVINDNTRRLQTK